MSTLIRIFNQNIQSILDKFYSLYTDRYKLFFIWIRSISLIAFIVQVQTFVSISKENVHSDHQSIWVDPNLEGHVINGTFLL